MSGGRLYATLTLLLGLAALSVAAGAERLHRPLRHGTRMNRVSHLLGRHDDYEAAPATAIARSANRWTAGAAMAEVVRCSARNLACIQYRRVGVRAGKPNASRAQTIDQNAPPVSLQSSGDFRAGT
jgi:hypothetical protein